MTDLCRSYINTISVIMLGKGVVSWQKAQKGAADGSRTQPGTRQRDARVDGPGLATVIA
jgi:hypothetical protein